MPHISAYLKTIEKTLLAGNATKHTYRPGRTLVYDDLTHYGQTLAALAETIRLMSEIDLAVAAHGDWPLT